MIDPVKLASRVGGRNEAKEIIKIIQSSVGDLTEEGKKGFYDELKNNLTMLFGKEIEELKEKARGVKAMTDKECRILGQQQLAIGNKYHGTLVCDVPLTYLDWLIQKNPRIAELERYLANEKVAEQLRKEIE